MKEIKLTRLYIYPVKSLGGISLTNSEVEDRGLKYDRRWMLVDEEGKFLTQRKFPEMVHFKLKLVKDGFQVFHKVTNDAVIIPFETQSNAKINVDIWNDEVEAIIVSETLSSWFTDKLNFNCELVFMPDDTIRKVENKPWVKDEIVSFADGYPFLIISEESLDDLSSKLGKKLKMDRFRPNFVISGSKPFEEDEWVEFKIGSLTFKGVKPCARCVVTTIDQETGEKDFLVLEELGKYRKIDNKIMFGQNLLQLSNGSLSLYDKIEVIKRKI